MSNKITETLDELERYLDEAETDLASWTDNAWNGRIPGDARDFMRAQYGVFKRLRDRLGVREYRRPKNMDDWRGVIVVSGILEEVQPDRLAVFLDGIADEAMQIGVNARCDVPDVDLTWALEFVRDQMKSRSGTSNLTGDRAK